MKVRTENDEVIEWKNKDGLLHREDGPAIEYADGTKVWYLNGEFHREDGPTIEYVSGHKEWYLNGKQITEQEFNNFILRKRLQRIINF
jgi:hypothetical protein